MDNISYNELEEMRAQMALLKSKLEHEEIVNDRVMRETMKQKIELINHKAWTNSLSAVLAIVLVAFVFPYYGFSNWLLAYTVVMMLVCMLFTWIDHRGFTPDIMNGDLLTAAKRMRKLKKDYRGWHYIGYPMLAVWTVWFIYEVSVRFEDANMARAMIVGLVVGLLIGGFIGIKLERNTLKRVDEIIDSIEK